MPLTEEQITELARAGHEAVEDFYASPANERQVWEERDAELQEEDRVFVRAVVATLLPPGTIAIPEAELRTIIAKMREDGPAYDNEHMVVADELIDRLERLLDPLPEGT